MEKPMRTVTIAILLVFGLSAPPALAQRPAAADTSAFKPITELGTAQYKSFTGGLYGEGKNDRPAGHEVAGVALGRGIGALDREGRPDEQGAIVLLSLGMSNTTQEFSAFQRLAREEKGLNPRLKMVDGAQGGMTAAAISRPEMPQGRRFWETVQQRLTAEGVSGQQVQAVWLKEADARPTLPFPRHAKMLAEEEEQILRLAKERFPNLRLAYLSSRIYAGYATTPLNPEPYAYESAFAVRWVIEKQLAGDKALNYNPAKGAVVAPWVSWGPYLWANGKSARADGLAWEPGDFGGDGTHPSDAGRRKVARLLLEFFKTDATAKPWFLGPE
jgi:hypothetical protein